MRSEPTHLRLSIVSLLDSVVVLTQATSVTGTALKCDWEKELKESRAAAEHRLEQAEASSARLPKDR